MKNIRTMSQEELDAPVVEADASHGGKMLAAVYDFLGRFVAYPSEHAHVAHSLWIVHTHLMERWESTPRLAFLSAEPASGKTRALEVTELLVPHPVSAVNVSPAYLFRKVGNEESVTILFDEIDTVFGPKAKENEEIRGLLNAGHRRGAVAGRCVVHGKQVKTEEIPAYAPVALAGLLFGGPVLAWVRTVYTRLSGTNDRAPFRPERTGNFPVAANETAADMLCCALYPRIQTLPSTDLHLHGGDLVSRGGRRADDTKERVGRTIDFFLGGQSA